MSEPTRQFKCWLEDGCLHIAIRGDDEDSSFSLDWPFSKEDTEKVRRVLSADSSEATDNGEGR